MKSKTWFNLMIALALVLSLGSFVLGPSEGGILMAVNAQAQGTDPQGSAFSTTLVGTSFTYQGHLNDGGILANGDYDFEFKLYDAASSGSQMGSTVSVEDVTVTGGLFSVELDFGNVFDGTALWLEIGVRPGSSTGNYTTLIPLQALTPAPYALALPGVFPLNGNIGIGTTSPEFQLSLGQSTANTKLALYETGVDNSYGLGVMPGTFRLHLNGSGARFAFLNDDQAGASEIVTIKGNGNVGIGTTSPNTMLHIDGTGIDNNGSTAVVRIISGNGAQNLLLDGNEIDAIADGLFLNNNTDQNVILANGGGNVILANGGGNVGIGTTSPEFLLSLGQSTANTKLALYETGVDNSYGLGVMSGSFRLHLNGSGARFAFLDDDQAGANEIVTIKGSGNVGIGTTNPAFKLDVAGSAHASSFPTSSDARLKQDVEQLTNVLEKLEMVRGVSFEWNEVYESLGRDTGHSEIGVIAQEVEAVFPELVTIWGDEGYMAVDYGRLTAVLLEAVKELKADQDAQIAALQRQNADLEARVAALELTLSSAEGAGAASGSFQSSLLPGAGMLVLVAAIVWGARRKGDI